MHYWHCCVWKCFACMQCRCQFGYKSIGVVVINGCEVGEYLFCCRRRWSQPGVGLWLENVALGDWTSWAVDGWKGFLGACALRGTAALMHTAMLKHNAVVRGLPCSRLLLHWGISMQLWAFPDQDSWDDPQDDVVSMTGVSLGGWVKCVDRYASTVSLGL